MVDYDYSPLYILSAYILSLSMVLKYQLEQKKTFISCGPSCDITYTSDDDHWPLLSDSLVDSNVSFSNSCSSDRDTLRTRGFISSCVLKITISWQWTLYCKTVFHIFFYIGNTFCSLHFMLNDAWHVYTSWRSKGYNTADTCHQWPGLKITSIMTV